jgi:hypothetical protein
MLRLPNSGISRSTYPERSLGDLFALFDTTSTSGFHSSATAAIVSAFCIGSHCNPTACDLACRHQIIHLETYSANLGLCQMPKKLHDCYTPNYRPGHVLIFLSGKVYHRVSKWMLPPSPDKLLTPGRIGNVYFFPQASYDLLKGKKQDWNILTGTGKSPDVSL